jgi:glutamine synthetase
MFTCMEYIWLDGDGGLRCKTKVVDKVYENLTLQDVPEWNYDGSSTKQASGTDSEVMIRPVKFYPDPFRPNGNYLVMCDTWLPDGTPHPTNTRAPANLIFEKYKSQEPWYGMEQEFFFMDPGTNKPLGWPESGEPEPQGKYYCSVGAGKCHGRDIMEECLKHLLYTGLFCTGWNAEVAFFQFEFQVRSQGVDAADDMYMMRYILERTAEKHNVAVTYDSKPVAGDWNGSGCHVNFSTRDMRESDNGYQLILEAIDKLADKHAEHIAVYGADNHKRLSGIHETSSMERFSSGVADRGASIRIPRETVKNGKGYFEDRRPSSSMDPYVVCAKILETVNN